MSSHLSFLSDWTKRTLKLEETESVSEIRGLSGIELHVASIIYRLPVLPRKTITSSNSLNTQ